MQNTLGERDQNTAVAHIVRGAERAVLPKPSDVIANDAFGSEIDHRQGSGFFAAGDEDEFALLERGLAGTEEPNTMADFARRQATGARGVFDVADHGHGRCRIDRAAFSFIVQRNVAGDDRGLQHARRLGQTFARECDDSPITSGTSGLPKFKQSLMQRAGSAPAAHKLRYASIAVPPFRLRSGLAFTPRLLTSQVSASASWRPG